MQNQALKASVDFKPACAKTDMLKGTSLQILQQLETGLKTLSQQQYTHCLDENTSSIGGHARHIVEFYQALFKFLKGSTEDVLCYDKRQRNQLLETSKDAVLHEVRNLKVRLVECPDEPVDIHMASIINPNQPMITMRSTLQRELFYLLDHTIHHMALIKMLAERQAVAFERGFGLAQSTKDYESK